MTVQLIYTLAQAAGSGNGELAASLGREVAESADSGAKVILLLIIGGALVIGGLILAVRYQMDSN